MPQGEATGEERKKMLGDRKKRESGGTFVERTPW